MADAPYRKYRATPRLARRRERSEPAPGAQLRPPAASRDLSPGRVVRWLLLAVLAWVTFSALVFLVSATLHQTGGADRALAGEGIAPFSPTTILVLGSDQRTSSTAEPGSSTTGPSRSDTMLLMRVGGGANSRLSIPRDTLVEIPGRGVQKINAAYAIGGPALAVETVERFLGLEVDHLIEVDFENFPGLIDAMGGIDYTGGCVVSLINGGFKNGGYTLRLKRGTTRIDGRQALALARTRKNRCNPQEDDRTRARRQQKILGAMKSRMTSPGAFIRLPRIAWDAPRAVRSDMSGPTLIGVFAALAVSGDAPPRVLRATPQGNGLVVDAGVRQRAVRRFLAG